MELANTAQMKDYISNYLNDFLVFMESKGSKKTSDSYEDHLQTFAWTMYNCRIDFLSIEDLQIVDTPFITKYIQKLYKSGFYSNGTINAKLSALKKFLRYMQMLGKIDYKVNESSEFIVGLKNDTEHYETMSMEMVSEVIAYIRTKEKRLQNQKEWYIRLAVETGLRQQDILQLTKDQFLYHRDGIHVLIKSSKDNKGKGNEEWKDLIHINVFEEMKEALYTESDRLFTMDSSTIRKCLKKIIAKLGYDGNYVPHSLKRTAVNNTKDLTNDIQACVAKGKHKNPATTLNNYMDDVKFGATGYYSMQHKIKEDHIATASREDLLKAIDSLDESVVLLLQMQLQKQKEGK